MGRKIKFGPNKGLKVVDGPMAKLGASATSHKRAKLDANYSTDRKRDLSPKPKKRSKGTWGPSNTKNILIPALGKKKSGAGRPGTSRRC